MRLKHKKNLFQFQVHLILHGFSLVELMTVIGIVGIMTSIVLVSFSSGRSDEILKTSAREVANALREAQNDALAGFRPESIPSSRTVCWFSLERENSTNATIKAYYSQNGDCSSPPSPQTLSVRTLQLLGGATFPGTWAYGFRLPHGTVVSGGSGTALSGLQSIGITVAGKSIAVCLDPASGSVRETMVGGSCS